jgi:hypothetical protein
MLYFTQTKLAHAVLILSYIQELYGLDVGSDI